MAVRKCLLSAAVAAMAFGSVAWAADQTSQTDSSPVYLQAAPSGPTSLTPVMFLLDPSPVGKWMENNKISITGFAEGGYFYDTSNPRMGNNSVSKTTGAAVNNNDAPTFVAFPGGDSNRGVLDQLDLTIQKSIDTTKSWDWGFLFENGYGVDDSFIHSYGVMDHRAPGTIYNKGGTGEGTDPDNQYDIIQANVSLLVPIGSGLTLTAGKFVTILSNEVINPTGNQFYTHSYNFTYGVPSTSTGITASYTFAKAVNGNDLTILGGVTRNNQQEIKNIE